MSRHPNHRAAPPIPRRAMTTLDAIVALTILGLALAGVARLLMLTARQTQAMSQRRWELQEAENLLEQAAALPWDELSLARLGAVTRAAGLQDQATNVQWALGEDGPARIVTLSLQGPAAERPPVELVLWRYPPPSPGSPRVSTDRPPGGGP